MRTKGELAKKEGGNIFGLGSRTSVTILLLVKNGKNEGCKIKYSDIGDYLKYKEKLVKIEEVKSFKSLDLIDIKPDKYGSWFNKRDDSFDNFIPLYPEKKFGPKAKSFFVTYSLGIEPSQDSLFLNFSKDRLNKYFSEGLDFYNSERERYQNSDKSISLEEFVNRDNTKLNFNREILGKLKANIKIFFENSIDRKVIYRPFCISNIRNEIKLMAYSFQIPKFFPNGNFENIVICVSGAGNLSNFSCFISNKIIERQLLFSLQAFPLYWYEKQENRQGELDLFADNLEQSQEQYIRRDGISDWIYKRAKDQYSGQIGNKLLLTKEDIFYYVYGFLHLESYRKKFANNLKNELPKIPLVEDYATFEKISKAGRDLAELHLNFEPEPNVENVTEADYENNYIKKVEESKDKRELLFFDRANNVFERLPIPPEVDKWQINGSTATWWIADRYKVTVDKKTGRINDPNDYAREYGNPRYIIELAKNVINIAVRTVKILDELNKLQVEI